MSNTLSVRPMRLEALKTIYEGQLGALRAISERSFTTTLQTLALNIAVVAGLIGTRVVLSTEGRVIGSSVLVIFNGLVLLYLLSKSRAYGRELRKFIAVQTNLATVAGVAGQFPPNHRSFLVTFVGGSGIFILAVALACACSVSALWMPLVSSAAGCR